MCSLDMLSEYASTDKHSMKLTPAFSSTGGKNNSKHIDVAFLKSSLGSKQKFRILFFINEDTELTQILGLTTS